MDKLTKKIMKNPIALKDCPDIDIKILKPKPRNKEGAIMFTDVKASSQLWGFKKGQEWNNMVLGWINAHFDIIQQLLVKFNMRQTAKTPISAITNIVKGDSNTGKIVKTVGDAAMIYCPWKLKKCIRFSKCVQKQMKNLNKKILEDLDKIDAYSLYEKIPGPKLDNTIFSIRMGFCYGNFNSLTTPIQHCKNFEDFFGPAVNLASRMESKVSDLPGAIAFTYYKPGESIENINKMVEDAINDIEADSTYIYYTFNTDTKFNELDIPTLLHGALPLNTTLPVFVLLPDSYSPSEHSILKKGNIKSGDKIIKRVDGKLEIDLDDTDLKKLIKTYSGKLGIRSLFEDE